MSQSFAVFEIQRYAGRKSPILTYPTCIWRHRSRWLDWNFADIFGRRKLESQAIVWRCFSSQLYNTGLRRADRDTQWQKIPH